MADTDTTDAPVTPLPGVTVTAPNPLQGSPDAAVQALIGRLDRQSKGAEGAIDQLRKQYAPQIDAAAKDQDAAGAALVGTLKTAPKPEETPAPDLKAKQMSAAATMGVIVAGLLAGRAAHVSPFLTAADSVTQAYKAYNANDQRRLDAALTDWKAKSAAMQQHNEAARVMYNDAMETAKTNLTLAQSKLKMLQQTQFDGITQQYDQLKSFQSQAGELGKLIGVRETAQNHYVQAGEALARISVEKQRAAEQVRHDEAEEARAGVPTGFQRDPSKQGALVPMPGGPHDPTSPNYAPAKAASGMNPTMANTVKLDVFEVRKGTQQMRDIGGTSSAFFADNDHPGALRRWLYKDLTPAEQQKYDVAANRMATAIASMQSMGRGQVSNAKVDEARKLVPVPGDDQNTIQYKLKYIDSLADAAQDLVEGKTPSFGARQTDGAAGQTGGGSAPTNGGVPSLGDAPGGAGWSIAPVKQ